MQSIIAETIPAGGSPYQSAVPPSTVSVVRRQACPQCGTRAGFPCSRHGDHLARWIATMLADGGRILPEDVVAAVAGLDLLVRPGSDADEATEWHQALAS